MSSTTRDLRHIFFEGKAPARHQQTHPSGHFIKARATAPPISAEPLDEFCAWVLERAGMDASAYRSQSLHRRLPACLRALKVCSTEDARTLLEHNPRLVAKAINALLIGVTEFFRDPTVFDYLKTQILPAFHKSKRPLRIWSAACSTGAELYSMAILLDDAKLLNKSYLLGTDCREEAIDLAKRGLYDDAQLKLVPQTVRKNCFLPVGKNWTPAKVLRRQVHWKISDLLSTMEHGPWDIIFWRNAAIYLNANYTERIWRQLVSVLAPGGILIVGKAERPPFGVELSRVARCVYRNSSSPPVKYHRQGASIIPNENSL